MSPLVLELQADAGERTTSTIVATASGDEPITVELVHADFGFGEDYEVVLIDDDAEETTGFSTRGWFSLPQERYRIAAGRSRAIPLRIDVPRNTPGGTYLGAALLRIVPDADVPTGGQVQAIAQSGPLVFVAVDGGAPPKPVVDRFSVPRVQRGGPVRPELVIANDGDEYFTIEGSVRLRGRGVDEEVEVRRQFVVPGEPREVRASAEDSRSDAGPLRLGDDPLPLGRYEVTTRLRIEPTGTTLVSTRSVWVVPTWAWIAATCVLLLAIAGIIAIVRRRRAASDDELDA